MKRPGLKKASKRQTLHQKHKVAKKVREHNRKQRKQLKKGQGLNVGSRFTKRTRDPGIPANCPFSDQILKDAQEWKLKREEEKEEMKKKQQKWQQLQTKRKQMGFKSVEDMLENAVKQKQLYEKQQREKIENESETVLTQKGKRESQNFWRQVNQVIDTADVVLAILDARDPEGSRCKKFEEAVSAKDKKLILVLNKIDLVPLASTKAWLKFYRRTVGPTLAFRATTQSQRIHLSQSKSSGKMSDVVSGTQAMCSYLANYGRMTSEDGTSKIRTAVTVGVVGLPNVGKSSIINTLKRNKSCEVGGKPGVTRSLQTVHIDTYVKLIDSPGVVIDLNNSNAVGKVLLHALDVGAVSDSREAATEIIKRCGSIEKMAFHYQLEVNSELLQNNVDIFLSVLARRRGFLKKGGKPDGNAACKFLVKEWVSGKLSFHTMPPEIDTSEKTPSASIKTSLGEELDVDMLDDGMSGVNENCVLFRVPENTVSEFTVDLDKSKNRKRKVNFDMETGEAPEAVKSESEEEKVDEGLSHLQVPKNFGSDLSNMQCDTDRRKFMKKRKRQLKKSRVEMEGVADDLERAMSGFGN